ncbi:MAG: hypothetical protein IJW63_01105 [Lachnospiraceae bacterium]|nr:hypothetical protein [Lachnospiraceae bacterium]
MNKMDARRKQILFLIYTFGFLILNYICSKLSIKTGGYLMVIALIFVCFFLPFFSFLPIAIEKPLRARISKGQIKNANGLWSVVFGYTLFTSVLLGIVMALFVPSFAKEVLQLSSVSFCVPFFAPAFVFFALSRALCVYFQGKGSGLQTVISSALIICFTVLFAYVFGNPLAQYGQKVADLMGNQEFKEQYFMTGLIVGLGVAAVITFIFLFFAFFLSVKENSRNKNAIRQTEHKIDSTRIFVANFFPYWFATLMVLLPFMLSFVLFFERFEDKIAALKNLGTLLNEQYIPWAIFSLLIFSFVVLIVSQISTWIKREEIRQARDGFRIGLVWVLMVSSFVAVCHIALGSWKVGLLFFGATFAYFFFTLLWQGGKRRGALVSMFVSMVASMSVSFLMSGMLQQVDNIIFIPATVQLGTMAFCAGFFLIKHYRFTPDWLSGFAFPVLSSAISGLFMYLLSKAFGNDLGSVFLSLLIILLGAIVHIIICMALQCGNDHDMLNLPGGKLWIYIGNRLRLFR